LYKNQNVKYYFINFIVISLILLLFIAIRNALAYPADEAAGMPLSGQGRHVVLHYGPSASTALGSEHVEVIVFAVRATFALVESFLAELFSALGAEKVFRVPGLLQGRHTFLKTGGKKPNENPQLSILNCIFKKYIERPIKNKRCGKTVNIFLRIDFFMNRRRSV